MSIKKLKSGDKFNSITLIEKVKRNTWIVKCDCGNTYQRYFTTSKALTVCRKCSNKTCHHIKHGGKNTRLYKIWIGVRNRCNNPNTTFSKYYHDKGIKMCDEWNDFKTFREWALKNGYDEHLTIERIDNDKNYCPENCKWITQSEQSKHTSRVKLITVDELTFNLTEWATILNISYSSIRWAIRTYKCTYEQYIKYRMDYPNISTMNLSNEERKNIIKKYFNANA